MLENDSTQGVRARDLVPTSARKKIVFGKRSSFVRSAARAAANPSGWLCLVHGDGVALRCTASRAVPQSNSAHQQEMLCFHYFVLRGATSQQFLAVQKHNSVYKSLSLRSIAALTHLHWVVFSPD